MIHASQNVPKTFDPPFFKFSLKFLKTILILLYKNNSKRKWENFCSWRKCIKNIFIILIEISIVIIATKSDLCLVFILIYSKETRC